MIKNEKASLSVRKIAAITILLIFLCGVGVMATNIKLNNVKIVLSNNYEMNVLTTKTKVSDILEENHIVVLPEENVMPNMDSQISENRTITITKSLEEGQDVIKLAEANSEVSMEQLLGDYVPVIEKIITEQVEIPFETITKDSSNGTDGTNKILTKGKNGLKEITYRAKFKNDIEIERTVLSETIITEPVNQVVQVNKKAVTSRSSSERTASVNPASTATSSLAQKVAGITPTVKNFNTSAYCACMKCCGKTNGITSSGAKASSWCTLAAGKAYPIGTIIYIPYFKNKPNGGWFIVQDRGGAISNNRLDVYMGTHSQALQFGRRNLECYVYYM
ncbi:MAG: G5 domain-containing protein [Clostridia bacterium]|nr:G5 domain-containing protein [Clostridia bacterium]